MITRTILQNMAKRTHDKSRLRQWNRLDALALFFQHSRERAVSRLLRRYGKEMEGWDVLDFGCGSGRLLQLLREMGIGTKGSLIGCDVDAEVFDCDLTGLGMGLVRSPTAELPFADQSFDLVVQAVVFSSIHNEEVRRLLALEMDRVLKPSGRILWYDVTTTHAHLVGFGRKNIAEMFPSYRMEGFRCGLAYGVAAKLAYKSQTLVTMAEAMPFWRSHWAMLLSKSESS